MEGEDKEVGGQEGGRDGRGKEEGGRTYYIEKKINSKQMERKFLVTNLKLKMLLSTFLLSASIVIKLKSKNLLPFLQEPAEKAIKLITSSKYMSYIQLVPVRKN